MSTESNSSFYESEEFTPFISTVSSDGVLKKIPSLDKLIMVYLKIFYYLLLFLKKREEEQKNMNMKN